MWNGGGGFRSYGDSSSSRWGKEAGGGRDSSRERDVMREPLGPSRADEADDWSKGKRSPSTGGGGGGDGFDRGGGRERGSSFFEGGGGFEKRGSFDSLSRDQNATNNNGGGGSADSETWGRKRDESNGVGNASSARPRLVLQPRTAAPITLIVLRLLQTGPLSIQVPPSSSTSSDSSRCSSPTVVVLLFQFTLMFLLFRFKSHRRPPPLPEVGGFGAWWW
ncbi:Eukaryotic translation initiation factor 4B3 [Linum perenne]